MPADGSDVDMTDTDGVTALHKCAETNFDDGVHELVGAGANLHAVSAAGRTALIAAVRNNALDCARELLDGGVWDNDACVKSAYSPSRQAMFIATADANIPMIELLLGRCNADAKLAVCVCASVYKYSLQIFPGVIELALEYSQCINSLRTILVRTSVQPSLRSWCSCMHYCPPHLSEIRATFNSFSGYVLKRDPKRVLSVFRLLICFDAHGAPECCGRWRAVGSASGCVLRLCSDARVSRHVHYRRRVTWAQFIRQTTLIYLLQHLCLLSEQVKIG